MGDILKYRFPNKDIVHRNGEFICLDNLNNYKGFILSSFDKSKLFGFIESKSNGELSFNSVEPICYSKDEYSSIAQSFLFELKKLELSKAILSRVEKHNDKLNPEMLFNLLEESYPNAFVYLVSSSLFGTWIGVSPEILLKDVKGKANIVSLAGTKISDDESVWTEKEKLEQQYVSDFILDKLKKASSLLCKS